MKLTKMKLKMGKETETEQAKKGRTLKKNTHTQGGWCNINQTLPQKKEDEKVERNKN